MTPRTGVTEAIWTTPEKASVPSTPIATPTIAVTRGSAAAMTRAEHDEQHDAGDDDADDLADAEDLRHALRDVGRERRPRRRRSARTRSARSRPSSSSADSSRRGSVKATLTSAVEPSSETSGSRRRARAARHRARAARSASSSSARPSSSSSPAARRARALAGIELRLLRVECGELLGRAPAASTCCRAPSSCA